MKKGNPGQHRKNKNGALTGIVIVALIVLILSVVISNLPDSIHPVGLQSISESPNIACTFSENETGWTITYYKGDLPEQVILPGMHEGKPVTAIGDYAFEGCDNIIDIAIPESVTSIGSFAFSGCTGLTSVSVPDSVSYIDLDAFSDTPWLDAQKETFVVYF